LNVGFLINAAIGTSREFNFDYDHMQLGDDIALEEFNGTTRFSRTPQGLLLQAEFRGLMGLECVRCLGPYHQQLNWTFTELYAFNKRSVTESELILPEDGQVDLEPLLREYVLLEVPIKPVCQPDCKGLCPVCGENCNLTDCGHRNDKPDSPFAVLMGLDGE